MGKLTKSRTRQHEQACALLDKDELTFDEKWLVLENWHEGASHLNTVAEAFFTPVDLTCDFKFEICGSKVIDLCTEIELLGQPHDGATTFSGACGFPTREDVIDWSLVTARSVGAVRPSGQDAQQHEQQDDDQDGPEGHGNSPQATSLPHGQGGTNYR